MGVFCGDVAVLYLVGRGMAGCGRECAGGGSVVVMAEARGCIPMFVNTGSRGPITSLDPIRR